MRYLSREFAFNSSIIFHMSVCFSKKGVANHQIHPPFPSPLNLSMPRRLLWRGATVYVCLKSGSHLILTELSVFQPQLEGFFACLDIWTVFLDYLIGKVANARSDKLAEAEATVSRFLNDANNSICGILRLCWADVPLASYADALWARHAIILPREDCVTSPKSVCIGG